MEDGFLDMYWESLNEIPEYDEPIYFEDEWDYDPMEYPEDAW